MRRRMKGAGLTGQKVGAGVAVGSAVGPCVGAGVAVGAGVGLGVGSGVAVGAGVAMASRAGEGASALRPCKPARHSRSSSSPNRILRNRVIRQR